MMLIPLTRKGESVTPVLYWFVGIAAAIILVIWFAKSSTIGAGSIERVDEDLRRAHEMLDLACKSDGLDDSFVAKTTGELVINATHVCVMSRSDSAAIERCLMMRCDLTIDERYPVERNDRVLLSKDGSDISITVER